MQATTETYLSAAELAARYGVSLNTVYYWNAQRTGPNYIRIGRQIRYPLTSVLVWEAARAQGGVA